MLNPSYVPSSMILFSIALSAEWWHPDDPISWITIGIAVLTVSVLVGWCVWTTRDRTKYWWFQADPNQASFVNDQPEGKACDGKVPRCPLLTKGITHLVHALFHKLNVSHSVGGSNLSVHDVEMRPRGEDTRAYQQRGDANCANRSPVIINIQRPTLPPDGTCVPPPGSSADVTSER